MASSRSERRRGGMKARRHGGTEARRHGGTEARRHEGTKAWRHEGTERAISHKPSTSFPPFPHPGQSPGLMLIPYGTWLIPSSPPFRPFGVSTFRRSFSVPPGPSSLEDSIVRSGFPSMSVFIRVHLWLLPLSDSVSPWSVLVYRFDISTFFFRSTRTFLTRRLDRQIRLPIHVCVHPCPSVVTPSQ